MTMVSRKTTRARWALPLLAALVAVLATILSSATASAATQGTAETRVRASSVGVEVPVGPPEHITAGQRPGKAAPRAGIVVATGVAAKSGEAVADGTKVLKGPIADAVPRNLPEQLALGAARDGQGTVIMRNLADAPRLVANYGEGDWVKMQYVLRGTDSNVTVHYFRNLTSKMDVEFKFK